MLVKRKDISDFSEIEKLEIDNFIKAHNGLIFHETKFNEIAAGTFHTKLFYFLASEDGKLAGVCPVHFIPKGKINILYSNNGSFEIPYGGWVYDEKVTNFQTLWENLPLSVNETLTYWSSFVNSDIPEIVKKEGKMLQTGIIDLMYSEEELFADSIHSKRRNMIRKAEKSGITIIKYGSEGLPIYFPLMQNIHKKAGFKEVHLKYYENILKSYYSSGNAVLMIAFYEKEPLAGVIITGNKNVMHYWHGASMSKTLNFGQGELLQWEAIKWAKKQGSKFYDLCVIEPERLPHIAQFKMGFTKELTPFYCINKKRFIFKILNKIQNVFPN